MIEENILQVLYPEGEYMNSVNVAWKLYLLFSAVQTFRFWEHLESEFRIRSQSCEHLDFGKFGIA